MPYFAGFSGVPKFAQAVTLDPANIPPNSTNVETFTVKGLQTSMNVKVDAPELEAGVLLISSRVSAKNTLELAFINLTESAINPASQTFNVIGL